MGHVIRGPWRRRRHARASAVTGRGTSSGQEASGGHFSENQRSADSIRPTVISAPSSRALSRFPSLSAREETVDRGTPSAAPYARATLSSCSIADMDALSVRIPVLSTVNLPDAHRFRSGYSTGMDHETLLANIERHLKTKKVSADAVSKLAKRPDAIRNLRRRVKGQFDGSMTLDTLIDIARALDVPPWELMRPPGAAASPDELRDLIDQRIEERLAAAANTPKRKIR